MFAHDEGTLTADDLAGTRRIFAYLQIPGTDARLAVGVNEGAVLSRVDRDIGIAYLQFGLLGTLVLLLAWFGGEQLIVRPIRSLARTAARFGRGDLEVHATNEPLMAEFQPLALAFDDMARKLAAREEELRIANEHLEELARLDGLTGLANRRGFDMRLDEEWQQARRTQQAARPDDGRHRPFQAVQRPLRPYRRRCLPARRRRDAFHRHAQRCGHGRALWRRGIRAAACPASTARARSRSPNRRAARSKSLDITHAEAPCGRVTISIGVAAMVPGAGEPAANLVEAADAGLYAAKRRCRNTVVAHAAIEFAKAS